MSPLFPPGASFLGKTQGLWRPGQGVKPPGPPPVPPASSVLPSYAHFTRFTEYTLGSTAPDWIDYGSGAGLTTAIGQDSDGERFMRVQKPAVTGLDGLIWDKIPATADAEVYMDFQSQSTSTAAGRFKAGVRMNPAAGTAYFGGHGQTVRARITTYRPTSALISESTGVGNYPLGTRIKARFQVIGSTQRVKVWRFGEVEPEAWSLVSDDANLSAAGRVGLFTFGTSLGVTDTKVYAFGVSTAPATGPAPVWSQTPSYRRVLDIAFPFSSSTQVTHLDSGTFEYLRDGGSRVHRGKDLHVSFGTPVYAMTDGVVHSFMPGSDGIITPGDGLGYGLQINTKKVRYTYGHFGYNESGRQSEAFAPGIAPGTTVTKGQLLGWAGNSGSSASGPHLHVDFRDLSGEVFDDPFADYSAVLGSESAPRYDPYPSIYAAIGTGPA